MVYIMSKMRASRRTKKLTHASQPFKRGVRLHQQGKREAPEAHYNQLLANQPNHFDAPHLLGVLRHQQGRNIEAPRHMGGAPRAQPAQIARLRNFGLIHAAMGRWDESPAVHESALAIKPDRPGTLTWRGNLFMDPNRPAEALARFDGALAQDQSVWWRSATGVLHSRTSSASAIGDHEGSFLADTYELEELVRYYRAYETLTTHWRRVSPPNVILEVQYEDVVADLEGQAGRVVAHRGLEGRALPRLSPNEKASARGKHDASAPTYLQKLRGSLARM